MTKVNYASSSQYYNTDQTSWSLGLWRKTNIPLDVTDTIITLTSRYDYNPGLLAYELYGDQKLWWVFVILNPDVLIDPIYDFKSGLQIRYPSKSRLSNYIG